MVDCIRDLNKIPVNAQPAERYVALLQLGVYVEQVERNKPGFRCYLTDLLGPQPGPPYQDKSGICQGEVLIKLISPIRSLFMY